MNKMSQSPQHHRLSSEGEEAILSLANSRKFMTTNVTGGGISVESHDNIARCRLGQVLQSEIRGSAERGSLESYLKPCAG